MMQSVRPDALSSGDEKFWAEGIRGLYFVNDDFLKWCNFVKAISNINEKYDGGNTSMSFVYVTIGMITKYTLQIQILQIYFCEVNI
jgi:deoxyribodipyrimidine photolyase-like uncharacterized protein